MIHLSECWQAYWSWLVTSSCQQNGRQSIRQLLAFSYGRSLNKYEFGSRPNLHIEVFLSNCANQPAPAYNTLLPLWQERLWLVERLQLMMELDEMDWSFSERWFPSSLELLLERSALWKVFMSSHDLNGLLQQGLCLLEFRFDVILDWKMLWAL